MGAPPIPSSVPFERLPFVAMRTKPGTHVEGLEDEEECYYTDTGESIPDDEDEEDDDEEGESSPSGGVGAAGGAAVEVPGAPAAPHAQEGHGGR
jgi:hypothetical protein